MGIDNGKNKVVYVETLNGYKPILKSDLANWENTREAKLVEANRLESALNGGEQYVAWSQKERKASYDGSKVGTGFGSIGAEVHDSFYLEQDDAKPSKVTSKLPQAKTSKPVNNGGSGQIYIDSESGQIYID